MLTTTEILKKVKELEIKSKRLTRHLFTGEYHSAFKGRGMSFKEVREYHAGDDVRFIDWNVSARFNTTFSKLFEEERELTMMLLVDISASSLFGTVHARKKDLVTEIGAILAFSAISNNDKAGAVLFSDGIEKYIPPKKGRDHGLFIVRELLTLEGKKKGTDIASALRYFNNTTRQKSILFVLSDFLDPGFSDALRVAGKKHDVIGIKVYDPMDVQLPEVGLLDVEDAETGKLVRIDSNDYLVRKSYQEEFFRHTEWCKQVFLRAGCDLLHISTKEDYVKVLQKFFIGRS
ncbi:MULTISPECIES: DUF58 domain-containing protein [unclassified Flavihumibacter]|uniref:DUF58 domain-containing protein n=1 Tax=unclassified Flavihumibacter TaxID=2621068 RepID=UPI00057EADF0|nr:DUF58 domain-containing protein [Flavihumibacter sp. ZG627]KIC89171.1 hypothetical protein HY58_18130 [Flavihumibacter sp. ZG627]MCG7857470.1 DUF58 domain-containing protein [Flavihumibacter sediminis]